jgi:hypothetical protein
MPPVDVPSFVFEGDPYIWQGTLVKDLLNIET